MWLVEVSTAMVKNGEMVWLVDVSTAMAENGEDFAVCKQGY